MKFVPEEGLGLASGGGDGDGARPQPQAPLHAQADGLYRYALSGKWRVESPLFQDQASSETRRRAKEGLRS